MYPWIRLTRSRLSLVGAKRVDPLSTTSVHLRVWPNDLDFNLHVNNGRYLTLADISRMHWFMSTGVWQVTRSHGAIPIVGDALAKFRRDLKVFERFEIQARMVGWNERWGFLEHRFIRNGRVLGVVAVRGVFKGPKGTIAPAELMSELGVSASSPALPKWIDEWNAGCESLSEVLRAEERERGIR